MAKKLQAERDGKDWLTALIADVEMGHKHLSVVKEMLGKCVQEGIIPDDLMSSVLGGDFGDVVVDDLMQGFKEEFGEEFSDLGVPDSVMEKIMTKMLHAKVMGKEPDMDDYYEIFMESLMEEGLGEMFREPTDEYLFTEIFTPQRKAPKKRRRTKNKRKQPKTAPLLRNI